MSSAALDRFADQLQQEIDNGETGGIQVVVARRGRVVMHESFGFTNIDTRDPVNSETLFRIYSMTKPVTAAAMMILYEEGKFSLSDPISKYIPSFANLTVFSELGPDGEIITEDMVREPTIHDLFLHIAGFTYGYFSDTPVDKLYLEAGMLLEERSLEELVDHFAGFPLLNQPGSKYHYSIASDIQGRLIEVISGMDAETFIQQRILDPLDMDETMTWVPPDKASLLTELHVPNAEGQLTVHADGEDSDIRMDAALTKPTFFSGGAQLISTADDYFRFAQMLQNGGELDGAKILSPATVRMMTSNRMPSALQDDGTANGSGFNLSVVVDATQLPYPASNGEYSHGGYATTHFWVSPENQIVVVFLTQYLPYNNGRYVEMTHRGVLNAIMD